MFEVNNLSINSINLPLPDFLAQRCLRPDKRFDEGGKRLLSQAIRDQWIKETERFPKEQSPIINPNWKGGTYPDHEAYVHGKKIDPIYSPAYLVYNLPEIQDVNGVQIAAQDLRSSNITLVTANIPLGRGDRPEPVHDKQGNDTDETEKVLLRTLFSNLRASGVSRIIFFDGHSPATAFWAAQNGIAPLDLSILPGLFDEATSKKIINPKDDCLTFFSCDDGAKERGFFARDIAFNRGYWCDETVHIGDKTKKYGKTVVCFNKEILNKASGKTAMIGEDIISTGGTLLEVVTQLEKAGAKKIVILAPYAILVPNGKISSLISDGKISIVTTDARTMQIEFSGEKPSNIITHPLIPKLERLAQLDKGGVNFYSPQGQDELVKLGMCFNPWQIYCHG